LRYTIYHNLPLIFDFLGGATIQLAAFFDAGHAWDGRYFSAGLFDDIAISAGAGVLITLLNFRFTYVNYYISHTFHPIKSNMFTILLTRPFF